MLRIPVASPPRYYRAIIAPSRPVVRIDYYGLRARARAPARVPELFDAITRDLSHRRRLLRLRHAAKIYATPGRNSRINKAAMPHVLAAASRILRGVSPFFPLRRHSSRRPGITLRHRQNAGRTIPLELVFLFVSVKYYVILDEISLSLSFSLIFLSY